MQLHSPPPEDDVVGGRYELEEQIGEGSFAIAYRARDRVLGRTVALKMLRAQYAADTTFVSRFEQEARAAASVSHPNVVDVYDFGKHQSTFFIVMQYVPGPNLKQILVEHGPATPRDAVRLTRQILRGLAAIHAAGIIHRDIKPQNVLLGPDGVARVTDFGIAHADHDATLTVHGTTLGTVSYMAPEQAHGGPVTAATDLYAVGIVLYELLTGRLPFEGETPVATMLAHVQQSPPPLHTVAPAADISPALEAVVLRALAKDPAERFQTARDMAEALANELNGPASDETARTAVGTATPMVDLGATTQLSVPLDVGLANDATRALSAAAVRNESPVPRSVPPPLPARRPSRDWGRYGPFVFFALALAALGGVVAATVRDRGGSDEARTPQLPAVVATETTMPPAVTAAVTSTAAIASVPATVAPVETPVPAVATALPTEALAPTEPPYPPPTPVATLEPMPSVTPSPTSTPTLVPTVAPEPTETVPEVVLDETSPSPAGPIVDQPTDSSQPPPIVPIGGAGTEPGAEQAAGVSEITFDASAWEGGEYLVDSQTYGQAAVALYGGHTSSSSASLSFSLDDVPTRNALLSITGLDDEAPAKVAITLAINGVQVNTRRSPFPNWNGSPSANWAAVQFSLPPSLLHAGSNEIEITNAAANGSVGSTPYLLLGETRIEVDGAQLQTAAGPGPGAEPVVSSNPGPAIQERKPAKPKKRKDTDSND